MKQNPVIVLPLPAGGGHVQYATWDCFFDGEYALNARFSVNLSISYENRLESLQNGHFYIQKLAVSLQDCGKMSANGDGVTRWLMV